MTGTSYGSSVKQSSVNAKSSYPCAATSANAARMDASIAPSLVFPRPHERKEPAMRIPKTCGRSGVEPPDVHRT
jgi:hypothetical protein